MSFSFIIPSSHKKTAHKAVLARATKPPLGCHATHHFKIIFHG
jgi:hypothetical protein